MAMTPSPEDGGCVQRGWFMSRGVGISKGYTMKLGIPTVKILVLSGGHPNTHGWHAGGMHPTAVLSCGKIISIFQTNFIYYL